jgi:hypothetical protein
MEKETRKALKKRYEERKIMGGVYLIKNVENGRSLLESTIDIRASKNRFDFSKKNGICAAAKIRKDWSDSGSGSFIFEELETLTKKDSQTMDGFKKDIAVLAELWREKLSLEGVSFY